MFILLINSNQVCDIFLVFTNFYFWKIFSSKHITFQAENGTKFKVIPSVGQVRQEIQSSENVANSRSWECWRVKLNVAESVASKEKEFIKWLKSENCFASFIVAWLYWILFG